MNPRRWHHSRDVAEIAFAAADGYPVQMQARSGSRWVDASHLADVDDRTIGGPIARLMNRGYRFRHKGPRR